MSNTTLPLLEKLKQVFDVLDFSQEEKEKLLSELLDGVFTLAMAKTLKENPDLAEKLTPDKLDSLDPHLQSMFAEELQALLDDYISKLVTTVDLDKKQRIQDLWKS